MNHPHVCIGKIIATNHSIGVNYGTTSLQRDVKHCDTQEWAVQNVIKSLQDSAQHMVDEANELLREANILSSEDDQWIVTMQRCKK